MSDRVLRARPLFAACVAFAPLVCTLLASTALRAQGGAPVVSAVQQQGAPRLGQQDNRPTGQVSGRVILGDTQQPARFAQVVLIPAESVQTDGRPGGGFRGFAAGGNGRTDLEGQFTISGVAAGDYFVGGQVPGYVSETTLLQARAADGADAQALLGSLPVAHVTAAGFATVNLALTRGATIAGRIQWDDGSPASGVQVYAQKVTAGTSATAAVNQAGGRGPNFGGLGFAGGTISLTDDRGAFRVSGLAPATYVVRVGVQAPMAPAAGAAPSNFTRTQMLFLYAPGKLRRADAQTFTLREGEERGDVQMVLDLHALHTVSGRVSAASGPEPQSGSVRLVDPSDPTLNRIGVIGTDGTFTLMYVPSGSYTMTVSGASSNPAGGFNRGRNNGATSTIQATTFQQYSGSLTVTDTNVSGVAIVLTPNGSQ